MDQALLAAAHFMWKDGCNGSWPKFGAGIRCAIRQGRLELHEAGTYVRLLTRGGRADLAARRPRAIARAGEYISRLPEKEHAAPEWQAADGSSDPGSKKAAARPCSPGSASCGH